MPQVVEGSITIDFPDGYIVQKLDDTTFYKKHFQSLVQGLKAVDFLAFDPKKSELWLIEVKDYRAHRRTKKIDLVDEVTQKVLSSLSCLMAMRANANVPEEKIFAEEAIKKARLKVVIHLEQPEKPSKLRPKVYDPSNLRIKLREKVRSIDSKAEFLSIAFTRNVPWEAQ
jgi:hypothetical protein